MSQEKVYSKYAKRFDKGNRDYYCIDDCNQMIFKHVMGYCNALLKKRGYVFLNEVYKHLNIPMTQAGQRVGWTYNKENVFGDGFIDITVDRIEGDELAYMLDFNVDGDITHVLEEF